MFDIKDIQPAKSEIEDWWKYLYYWLNCRVLLQFIGTLKNIKRKN
jgi:hypothetical protein